jgi:hypothetical protein
MKAAWNVTCASGDVDADRKADSAYLVPVASRGTAEFPAAVFVRRASDGRIEEFPMDAAADTSPTALPLFSVADRTGDARAEIVFLTTACSASSCSSQVHVETWDGTAWRDVGPADAGVDNVDKVAISGKGAGSVVVAHGARVTTIGAGPTRAVTTTYKYDGKRYREDSVKPDPPVYLYHAIVDADTKFDGADFAGAIKAYQEAIANRDLKDWKKETGAGDGRAFLEGYALFRIALATGAKGDDPNVALDAVISRAGQDHTFALAAEKFRQGFQEKKSVHAGCVAATALFGYANGEGDNAAYIRESFYYGYANVPQKTFDKICPF